MWRVATGTAADRHRRLGGGREQGIGRVNEMDENTQTAQRFHASDRRLKKGSRENFLAELTED